MGNTLPRDLVHATHVFHALAEETRLEIIEHLKDGEQCVCDLTDALKTGQSRLSFHLKVLKDAGLIHDRREGRWTYYALNAAAFEDVEELVGILKKAAAAVRAANRCC